HLGVTRLSAALDSSGRLIGGLVTALIALLGGVQVVGGDMTLGQFVLFLTIAGSMSAPMLSLAKSADDLQAMAVSAGQLGRIAAGPHEDIGSGLGPAAPGRGELSISALAFAYPDSPRPVLSQATLKLAPGDKIALLGDSGTGKSTLASLL